MYSLFQQKLPQAIISVRHFILAASQNDRSNVNFRIRKQQQPNQKNISRARETITKQLSFLAPSLLPEEKLKLTENQAVGMVASSQANFMRVIVNSASEDEDSCKLGVELLCVVKAVLKKIKRRVLVGDQVLVGAIDWVDKRGMIENVFQRKTEILDPPVANVDSLLVLFSFEQPKIEPFTLTRFLIEAESTGIEFSIALNKAELVDKLTIDNWKSRLRSWGYEPVVCSIDTNQGLDTLKFRLRGRTSVIVGPSGVGKSSLINALRSKNDVLEANEDENWFKSNLGSKWYEDQLVGEVSKRNGRGKHTTRNVSLLPLSGEGYIADTPGFNQPSLLNVTKRTLPQYFPEIRKLLEAEESAKCGFKGCMHLGEPGCIVKGDWERYPYYFQLLDEIKIREEFQIRTLGTKRESDVRIKVGEFGVKHAEPRLEPKKHRRQSRKKVNQSLLDELYELDDDDDDEENTGN